jgi:hypothetical protein
LNWRPRSRGCALALLSASPPATQENDSFVRRAASTHAGAPATDVGFTGLDFTPKRPFFVNLGQGRCRAERASGVRKRWRRRVIRSIVHTPPGTWRMVHWVFQPHRGASTCAGTFEVQR